MIVIYLWVVGFVLWDLLVGFWGLLLSFGLVCISDWLVWLASACGFECFSWFLVLIILLGLVGWVLFGGLF